MARPRLGGGWLQMPRTAWMGDLSKQRSLHLTLPPAQNLGRARSGGAEPVGNIPCLVLNQGFPRTLHPTLPPPLTRCLLAGVRPGCQAPLPQNGGAGPPSPSEAAPPNPRWEIPAAAAAGSGRERSGAAAGGSPWERGQSPSCGFCALFRRRLSQLPPARPPYGRRRRAPRGAGPSQALPLAAGPLPVPIPTP